MKLSRKSLERLLELADKGASGGTATGKVFNPKDHLLLIRARAALLPAERKAKGGLSSRNKGRAGERSAVLYLREQGFDTTIMCPDCDGGGAVTEDVAQAGDQVLQETIKCPRCAGEGRISRGDVKRGFQSRGGGKEQADVLGTGCLFVEVKRQETINIHAALQQACDDCPEDKIPIVLHRRNNEKWKVTMRADDFFKIFRESEFMEVAALPERITVTNPEMMATEYTYTMTKEEADTIIDYSDSARSYGNEAPIYESFGEQLDD